MISESSIHSPYICSSSFYHNCAAFWPHKTQVKNDSGNVSDIHIFDHNHNVQCNMSVIVVMRSLVELVISGPGVV